MPQLELLSEGRCTKNDTTKDDGYLSFFAMSNSVRPDTSKAELSLYSSIYILAKVSHLKWRFPVNLTEFRDRPDLPHLLFTKNPNFLRWNWSIKNRLSKIVCCHKPSWYLHLENRGAVLLFWIAQKRNGSFCMIRMFRFERNNPSTARATNNTAFEARSCSAQWSKDLRIMYWLCDRSVSLH